MPDKTEAKNYKILKQKTNMSHTDLNRISVRVYHNKSYKFLIKIWYYNK